MNKKQKAADKFMKKKYIEAMESGRQLVFTEIIEDYGDGEFRINDLTNDDLTIKFIQARLFEIQTENRMLWNKYNEILGREE